MRLVFAMLLVATPAWAQTSPPPQSLGTVPIAPALPAPTVDDDSPPLIFLLSARQAIADGKLGVAQEALERAESRALVRSVKPSRANLPSDQGIVAEIAAARHALASGDRATALDKISTALANKDADAAPE